MQISKQFHETENILTKCFVPSWMFWQQFIVNITSSQKRHKASSCSCMTTVHQVSRKDVESALEPPSVAAAPKLWHMVIGCQRADEAVQCANYFCCLLSSPHCHCAAIQCQWGGGVRPTGGAKGRSLWPTLQWRSPETKLPGGMGGRVFENLFRKVNYHLGNIVWKSLLMSRGRKTKKENG